MSGVDQFEVRGVELAYGDHALTTLKTLGV